MDNFLFQATIYLAAAVIAVPLAKRWGLGSVLGYLIAGVIIGQINLLLGSGFSDLHGVAEFGIIMLLFVIGLELEPKQLWQLRTKLLGLGGLQITLTTIPLALACKLLGYDTGESIALGLAFSLSSTAMVLQTLSEKGLTQTEGGRSTLSVLLTQDVAFIPMLIVIPLLASNPTSNADTASHGGHSAGSEEGLGIALTLIEQLPPWGSAGLTLISIVLVIAFGYFIVRPMFHYISSSGLIEISTAATLFVVVFASLLMTLVGFSPALGTFLAGVVLATSEFRHEMRSHIEPFKGLFLGLFFITVGSGINFLTLYQNLLLIFVLTFGLIAIKVGVLYCISLIFRIRSRDKWLFVLGLAQGGEFAFILLQFMSQTGVIVRNQESIFTLVVTMSMVLTPALFIAYEYIARKKGIEGDPLAEEISEQGEIIIAGVGRFGEIVNDVTAANGFKTTVLDNNYKVIKLMRTLGYKAFLGDPTRPELIESAGLANAEVLVVAIDKKDHITEIVQYARRKRPELFIIARAKDRQHVFELYQAGASQIVRETFDSSLRAGRYVLQRMGIPEDEAHIRTRGFFKFNRRATRELAAVWNPDIPLEQNQAFINKVRDLNRSIDSSIGIPKEDLPTREESPLDDQTHNQMSVSDMASVDETETVDVIVESEITPVTGEIIDHDEYSNSKE